MMPSSRSSASSSKNNSMVYLLIFCCCITMMMIGVGGYFYFSEDDKCDKITDRKDCKDNENCKWEPADLVCQKKCNPIDNSSDCDDNYNCIWDSSDSVCTSYIPPTDNTPANNAADGSNSDPSGENLPTTSTVTCGVGLEEDPSNLGSCRVISSTDGTSGTNTAPAPAPAQEASAAAVAAAAASYTIKEKTRFKPSKMTNGYVNISDGSVSRTSLNAEIRDTTIDACKSKCDELDKCTSFQWVPGDNYCNMISDKPFSEGSLLSNMIESNDRYEIHIKP